MMARTRILIHAEPSTAEVDSPLFPHTLLHQAVEDKDEKACTKQCTSPTTQV